MGCLNSRCCYAWLCLKVAGKSLHGIGHGCIGTVLVQTSGNDRDACLILGILIIHCTKYNIGFISSQLLNIAGRFIGLNQADIAGYINDYMACAFDGSF